MFDRSLSNGKKRLFSIRETGKFFLLNQEKISAFQKDAFCRSAYPDSCPPKTPAYT